MLYKLLANPLYIGKLRHKDNVYDGEHEAIIDADLFERVQKQLAMGAAVPKGSSPHPDAQLLTGLLFDDTATAWRQHTPSRTAGAVAATSQVGSGGRQMPFPTAGAFRLQSLNTSSATMRWNCCETIHRSQHGSRNKHGPI